MNQKFTAEEVRAEADFLSTYSRKPSQMLTAYADLLERIKADESAVTDAVVQRAVQAFAESLLAQRESGGSAHHKDMRTALLAVWPNPPARTDEGAVPVEHQYRRRMPGTLTGWSDWYHLHPENHESAVAKDGVEIRPLFVHPPAQAAQVEGKCQWCPVGKLGGSAEPVAQPADSGRVGDGFKFDDDGIRLALDYSRNYATARPDISPTAKEHVMGLCDRLESLLSDRAALAAQGQGEPVAWLAADGSGRVIDVKAKSAGARASATASATSVYSIPLYAAPPIDLAAVRDVIDWLRSGSMATTANAGIAANKLEAAIKGGA